MSFIKYSVGQITSVEDKEQIEEREETAPMSRPEPTGSLAVCGKCGLQHMVAQGEDRTCCGKAIRTN